MPPRLALLLCMAAVLACLRIDRKAHPTASPALWVPTLWLLIISSRMVSQWFTGDAALSGRSYEEGSPLDAMLFLALTGAAFAIVVVRRLSIAAFVRQNVWLTLYLAYCFLSIAWSDFPFVSFKRYIKEIGNVLMVLVVLSEPERVPAIRLLLMRCAYVLVPYSIVLYKYYSEFGRGYDRWTGSLIVTGVTNNKNSLGVLCAICGIAFCWNWFVNRRRSDMPPNKRLRAMQLAVAGMTAWLLGMAHSATSNVTLGVGISILIATAVPAVRRRLGLYMSIAITVGVLGYALADVASMMMGALGRDQTLTGRTEIWAKVLSMGTNPLVGVGYGNFWLGDRLELLWEEYAWHPTQSHNGYIDVYLELGLIGVVLLTGTIVSAVRSAIRSVAKDLDYGSLRLAILTVAILYNITESSFRPGLLMYFVFLMSAVNVSRVAFGEERATQAVPSRWQTRGHGDGRLIRPTPVMAPPHSPTRSRVVKSTPRGRLEPLGRMARPRRAD
jgi:exopolysaccharide production protein ExoQ